MELHLTVEHLVVDGLPLGYRRAGDGPPIVLIHGLGSDSRDWCRLMPILAERYTVYAPDLPGLGQSPQLAADYRPRQLARLMGGFLDELGIESAAVVGSSLGGLVALYLAVEQPERITALTLIASAGLGYSVNPIFNALAVPILGELALGWVRLPPLAIQRAFLRGQFLFYDPRRAPDNWYEAQVELARQRTFMPATLGLMRAQYNPESQPETVLPLLGEIRQPTLILWGENDLVASSRHALAARRVRPDSTTVLFSSCGHLPHIEYPAECADQICALVEQAERSELQWVS